MRSPTGREIVIARALGVCEICGAARGTDFSHRIAKGYGGAGSKGREASDSASNGCLACRDCHRRIESAPTLAYSMGWKIRRGVAVPCEVPAFLVTPHSLGVPEWVCLSDAGDYLPASPLDLRDA